MRSSSYVIHVELPDQPEQVLIIQGYTGAYDVVSRGVASYLRAHEPSRHMPAHGEWGPESPLSDIVVPSDATLDSLRKRGYLIDSTVAEERDRVMNLANATHEHELGSKPGYVLMMTYDCNLRCGYCFQDHMRTDSNYKHLLKAMDRPMIDRLISAMPEIDARHRAHTGPREVTLFGGEPLLASNRPNIEYLLERLVATGGATVYAITNATELDHYLDLLRPDAISSFQVTIDGPPADHDARRIRPDGSGSFSAIIDNLALAVERDVHVSVRINTDRMNVERLDELARVFISRGLDKRSNFNAYTAAVHAATTKIDKKDTFTQYALTKRLTELREVHPELACIDRPADEIKTRLRRIMEREMQPYQAFKASYCGAHSTMYVVDPFGDLYACWERTGDRSIRIGSIDQAGHVEFFQGAPPEPDAPAPIRGSRKLLPVLSQTKIAGLDAWRGRTFATNETCLSCKYAFYCGGGCAAEALDHKNAYYTNYCSGFQEKFRVAAAETFTEIRDGKRSFAAPSTSACGS